MISQLTQLSGLRNRLSRRAADAAYFYYRVFFSRELCVLVDRFGCKLQNRSQKTMLSVSYGELRRVHANCNAARARVAVVSREPALVAFIELTGRRQRQWMRGYDATGSESIRYRFGWLWKCHAAILSKPASINEACRERLHFRTCYIPRKGAPGNMMNRIFSVTVLFSLAALASATAQEDTPTPRIYRNIQYATPPNAPARLNQLDIHTPSGKGPHPVMVFIHGGSWRFGDKRMTGKKPEFFTGEGYIFVSINYRLSPAVLHPAHAEDCGKALAWIHKNIAEYGGDPKRIYVMGHSAGAHLAALIATDETYVKAGGADLSAIRGTILLDGAGYDIPTMVKSGELFAEGRYEKAFGESESTWRNASPVTHIANGKGIPPFLIVHAGKRATAKWQGETLAARLSSAAVKATVFNEPTKNHLTINADIGSKDDRTTSAIISFLNENSGRD